jgi:hypothetical protein
MDVPPIDPESGTGGGNRRRHLPLSNIPSAL